MSVIDVIKFDGLPKKGDWVVYKYPGEQFALGTQLIVNPSQEAVFIKGGEIGDCFSSGTHTLQVVNLPMLQKVIKRPFGGKTPFTAEVFFVNKAAHLDMTWGTATPFQLEDPKYGIIVSIRSHGKYGIKIKNSGLFIGELVGSASSDSVITHADINSYFNSMLISHIKTTISSFITKQKISFLDITSHLTELSKECNRAVANEFERYGIEIVNLSIETISPPPSDYESLKKMKEQHALDAEHTHDAHTYHDKPAHSADQGAQAAVPCPKCASLVPVGQKFCGECGTKMENKCPTCGAIWPASQKFCGECGAKL